MEEILGRIGQYGFFDEYTKHDITHIDAMLDKLKWIVTPNTREVMTSADWLLIVLAVYFHDLGMLITKDEYERRAESDFADFCKSNLTTSDPDGRDYSARLSALDEEAREKFLYQEFVRFHHAARVKLWIEGDASPKLGASDRVVAEIQRLIGQLDFVFKEDLAKVCESHHLDDLFDTKKYPVEQYYGSSSGERANVQFAAVLLRTVDLLHITRDRTPSVAFRIFNPSDPISQSEWAKQSAVRTVVPMLGVDKDGNPSEFATKDTVAVHATFTDENGFFGLTSYLKYAADELRVSSDLIQRSNIKHGANREFPWRGIDTSRVEARGFLTEPFQFTIDQDKVLDLLTGHTLYNDTNVVLRELMQNSIDAVRLHHGKTAPVSGQVQVRWDSKERMLEVCDNGTGMTQGVIENNLLRAGSSRYQDPEFKKEYPKFNPISRFGIGVLSTFMVADQVEIITCHRDEEKARQLSLRSVHGQYLVRTLDKNQEVPAQIREHGTIVRLTLRPSASLDSVTKTLEHWVVLPGCRVSVQEDEGENRPIGHETVGDALAAAIARSETGLASLLEKELIRVVERESESKSMTIAYALRWNEHFREWMFLADGVARRQSTDGTASLLSGVCVAGVRVEPSTPGFRSAGPIVALANTHGPGAPRTNVARSSLEPTPELSDFVSECYQAYSAHVIEEMQLLQDERKHSITWATEESVFIASPLRRQGHPVSEVALREAVRQIPFFLVEVGGTRQRFTAQDLQRFDSIESTESAVTEHVEYLLRELPGGTRESVVALLGSGEAAQDSERPPVLCSRLGRTQDVDDLFLSDWEIGKVSGDITNRSCDITWLKRSGRPRWSREHLGGTNLEVIDKDRDSYSNRPSRLARLPIGEIEASGFDKDMVGFIAGDVAYLLPGHPWAAMVAEVVSNKESTANDSRLLLISWLISQIITGHARTRYAGRKTFSLAETEELLQRRDLLRWVDWSEFSSIYRAHGNMFDIFDTRKWRRWEHGPYGSM
ncbi:ATP-binding protein [Streptomyces halstedii]|uniref:HD domain-containing protein n=1 Tax=Streptomyces halstedii TaxID=1944 RepID=UPI0037FE2787